MNESEAKGRGLGKGNSFLNPPVVFEAMGLCQFLSLHPNSLSVILFRCWSWDRENHASVLPVASSLISANRGRLRTGGGRIRVPLTLLPHSSNCSFQDPVCGLSNTCRAIFFLPPLRNSKAQLHPLAQHLLPAPHPTAPPPQVCVPPHRNFLLVLIKPASSFVPSALGVELLPVGAISLPYQESLFTLSVA